MKKILLIVFSLCCIMLVGVVMSEDAQAADIVESGKSGDNITWVLDDEGLLIISGTGEMTSGFYNKTSIKKVVINDGVTNIRNSAFYLCSNITSIEMPNSVTSIGSEAFSGCSSLTNIELPDSVTSIGSKAFCSCSSLKSIKIPNGVTCIKNNMFEHCSGLISIEIPDSVTCIESSAFNCCTSLKNIKIPSGVTSIESSTFYRCTNMESVVIPDNLANIKYLAFGYCSSLTSIELPNSVTSIENSAFKECSGLISIEIPSGVTSIGSYAFSLCKSLTDVKIPSSVTSIGDGAFYYCNSLTTMTIPFIGKSATESTYLGYIFGASKYQYNPSYVPASLKEIIILDGCTSIENYAFYNCKGLTNIQVPSSVTSIGKYAFYGCKSLTYIEIPSSVSSIGDCTFAGCSSLTSIEIPNSVKNIGSRAFDNCASLKSVKIPSSVTSIGNGAFSSSGLTSIEIPNSVTSIGEAVFGDCSDLTSIAVDSNNNFFDSRENCNAIIEKYNNKLIAGCQNTKIPNSVTRIGKLAFYSCESLTSIEIPKGVTSIEDYAFYYCTGLTSIEIPKGVTSIGNYTFSQCTLTVFYNENFIISEYYQGHITWIKVEVSRISLDLSDPSFKCLKGGAIDASDFNLNIIYNSGKEETIAITSDMLSGYDTSIVGKQNVTLTYSDKTLTIPLTVIDGSINSANITLGNAITLNVYCKAEGFDNTPTIRFTRDDYELIVEGVYDSASGLWTFAYDHITPQYMSTDIGIELLDGDYVVDTSSISVRDYCQKIYELGASGLDMSEEKYVKLLALIADMLEFGAKTQTYVEYKTDDLANSLTWLASYKTSSFTAPKSDYAVKTGITSANNKIKSGVLVAGNYVYMLFKYIGESGTKLVVTNEAGEENIFYTDTLEMKDGVYQITLPAISIVDLNDKYDVKLETEDDTILHEIVYSVNSYIARMNSGTDVNLNNVVKTLYNYGKSAKAFENHIDKEPGTLLPEDEFDDNVTN